MAIEEFEKWSSDCLSIGVVKQMIRYNIFEHKKLKDTFILQLFVYVLATAVWAYAFWSKGSTLHLPMKTVLLMLAGCALSYFVTLIKDIPLNREEIRKKLNLRLILDFLCIGMLYIIMLIASYGYERISVIYFIAAYILDCIIREIWFRKKSNN